MDCQYFSFRDTNAFSHFDNAYNVQDERLQNFMRFRPELSAFEEVISDRMKFDINRDALVEELKKQHSKRNSSNTVLHHINLLSSKNTFTIVTAHQPSLFTGPLYYIYKIISTIKLCQQLKEKFPAYNFIPVYWSGAEDHDFDEINHFRIFGKKIVWENNEGGSVGKMSNNNIIPIIDKLTEIIGDSENAKQLICILEETFNQTRNYGEGMLYFTQQLFNDFGLVTIDPSSKSFKELFVPVMRKELLHQASKNLVEETQEKLEELGFSRQAFPREINLFYTGKGFRERIIKTVNGFEVLNQNLKFTEEEILKELHNNPERFSPNVIMRPLYQESILPNLGYIGGGGELAYWIERKTQFKHFDVFFPMLIRRDSILWVDNSNKKKLEKTKLTLEDIWRNTDELIKEKILQSSDKELTLDKEKRELKKFYDSIIHKIKSVDNTLEKSTESEFAKALKGLENLERKMIRAEKKKHEVLTKRIQTIKENLFPENSLQERKDNFIPFYLKYGKSFFDILLEYQNPLDGKMKVIIEE